MQPNTEKLLSVYETEIPQVARYFQSEIDYTARLVKGCGRAVELGAGYGRVMKQLAPCVEHITGIDIAEESVRFGQEYLKGVSNAELLCGDVFRYPFTERYSAVICIQNGLSSLKNEADKIIRLALSLLKDGGKAIFSTCSAKFWPYRLAWFQEQADKGLVGELIFEKCLPGVITCKDGFSSVTFNEDELRELGKSSGLPYYIEEVGGASLFLVIDKAG